MDHHEEHHDEQTEEPPSSTGERPQSPDEGARPPASEAPDEEKVERAKEELRRTGAN